MKFAAVHGLNAVYPKFEPIQISEAILTYQVRLDNEEG